MIVNDQDDLVARIVAAVGETDQMKFLDALMHDPTVMRAYIEHHERENEPTLSLDQEFTPERPEEESQPDLGLQTRMSKERNMGQPIRRAASKEDGFASPNDVGEEILRHDEDPYEDQDDPEKPGEEVERGEFHHEGHGQAIGGEDTEGDEETLSNERAEDREMAAEEEGDDMEDEIFEKSEDGKSRMCRFCGHSHPLRESAVTASNVPEFLENNPHHDQLAGQMEESERYVNPEVDAEPSAEHVRNARVQDTVNEHPGMGGKKGKPVRHSAAHWNEAEEWLDEFEHGDQIEAQHAEVKQYVYPEANAQLGTEHVRREHTAPSPKVKGAKVISASPQKVTGNRPIKRSAVASGTNGFTPGTVKKDPGQGEAGAYRNPPRTPHKIEGLGVVPDQNSRRVKNMRHVHEPQEAEIERMRQELDSTRIELRRTKAATGLLIRNARHNAFRARMSRRERDLVQLEAEGYLLDRVEEMGDSQSGDAAVLADDQWENKINLIRRRYQRAPVGQMPVATMSMARGASNRPQGGIQNKDQMYAAVRATMGGGQTDNATAAAAKFRQMAEGVHGGGIPTA